MGVFQLDSSPDLFVAAPHTSALWVWQLNAPRSSGVEFKHWVYKHSIGIQDDSGLDHTVLKIHGVEIKGKLLAQLIEDLYMSQLIVNCQGYSYLDTGGVVEPSYSPNYYRLNDLFNWCEYTKVDPVLASLQYLTVTMINWDRCDFRKGDLVLVSIKHSADDDTKVEELKGKVTSMEAAIRKKDFRIAELEAKLATTHLPSDKEEEEEEDDEEFEERVDSVTKELIKKKDVEIASLHKDLAKADEMMSQKVKQLEEAQALLESANKKIVALEADLTKCHEERRKGGGNVEVAPEKPSVVLPKKPPPKPLVANPEQVVKSRRQELSDGRFTIVDNPLSHTPIVACNKLREFSPLDERVARRFPREVEVYIDEDKDFDTENWWYIKAMNKEDDWKETMVAFYDGGNRFGTLRAFGEAVHAPYKSGTNFSFDREIFVAHIDGVGKRFVFLYEEQE